MAQQASRESPNGTHPPPCRSLSTPFRAAPLALTKIKINQVKELTACPYCRSSGQLPCATCYGVGSVTIPDVDTATLAASGSSGVVTTTTRTCPSCRGKTFISCVNCKGDGRGVPLFLNKKVSRDPESEIEDVGYA